MGGTRYPEIVSLNKDEIAERVHKAHQSVFKKQLNPVDQIVFIHHNAIPLYSIGHSKKQDEITELVSKHEGLHLIGNHLYGVGVKDCIRNGTNTARRICAVKDKDQIQS